MFKTKNEMMVHRLTEHTDKVKPCRDPDNCTFKTCWYNHNKQVVVLNENDQTEKAKDFQKDSVQPKPPLNSTPEKTT